MNYYSFIETKGKEILLLSANKLIDKELGRLLFECYQAKDLKEKKEEKRVSLRETNSRFHAEARSTQSLYYDVAALFLLLSFLS
jgi:hypothetical protein